MRVRVRFSIVANGWLWILLRFNDLKNWRPSPLATTLPSHGHHYFLLKQQEDRNFVCARVKIRAVNRQEIWRG